MASILDSFKETFGDKFGFLKILVFAVPIYHVYTQYLIGAVAYKKVLPLMAITIFFLFGFIIKITNSVLNEKDFIMPALNPIKLAFSAFKGIIAILPATLICVSLANYINSLINIMPAVDITFKSIIWIIAVAIILTSFLMYVKTEKIRDAYNVKMLLEKAGDFIPGLIFFVLQLAIINVVTFGFICYTIDILFGFGPLLYFSIAYAIVFNLVASGHYMAQLQYEILGFDKQGITLIK